MEKAKIKLFGAEISVSLNDEQVLHNSTPSEYSPAPIGERHTISLLDQEKCVLHPDFVSAAADKYHEKDVLPTLGLFSATPSLSSSQVSRKFGSAKKRAFDEIDHHYFDNTNYLLLPFKKRFSAKFFRPQVGGGMMDESLLPTTGFGSTTDYGRSPSSDENTPRKLASKKTGFDEIHRLSSSSSTCDHGIFDDNKVYSPMPLRCFPPMNTILSAELGFSRKKNKPPKSIENKKKEKSLAISVPPPLPLENIIPGLMERIGSQNGSTKPVFLYKKKMEESDVRPHLNRLFISRSKIELMGFLSDKERAAVTSDTRKGLEFVGIDRNGESYNLRLVEWDSLRMTVVNKEWMRMVSANDVHKGDWVELWGYRANNEFHLIIIFRKPEIHIGLSSGSTCSTNLGD